MMVFVQTYGIYLFITGIILLCGIGLAVLMSFDGGCSVGSVLFVTLITIGLSIFVMAYGNWRINHTASGLRYKKDIQSEVENGIDREITITTEDGREIFHYEGKVDIESDHTDNYIKFEGEDGKRYIIYYGITDTVMIVEK